MPISSQEMYPIGNGRESSDSREGIYGSPLPEGAEPYDPAIHDQACIDRMTQAHQESMATEGVWQPPEEDREETLRMKAMGREYRRPQTPDEDPYPISNSGYASLQQQKEDRLFGSV